MSVECLDPGFYYNKTFQLYKYHINPFKYSTNLQSKYPQIQKKMSSNQELSHKAGEATGQVQVNIQTQKENFEWYCI